METSSIALLGAAVLAEQVGGVFVTGPDGEVLTPDRDAELRQFYEIKN